MTGGPRGLWLSRDGGTTWTATRFPGRRSSANSRHRARSGRRLEFALVRVRQRGLCLQRPGRDRAADGLEGRIRHLTHRGIGSGRIARRHRQERSKSCGSKRENPAKIDTIELGPLGPLSRVTDVQLNRFVRELHFGKGLVGSATSLVMNDIGGLGNVHPVADRAALLGAAEMVETPRQESVGAVPKATKAARRSAIVWLFRAHSATLGVASALMLIYLAATGIFIGHGRELGGWMKATRIPQAYLTPAFDGSSWAGWIDAIVAYPAMPGAFTIGNRVGMFTTVDNGRSWAREEDATGKPVGAATRLRRIRRQVARFRRHGRALAHSRRGSGRP